MEYGLVSKDGEVIAKVKTDDYLLAAKYFSEIKKIRLDSLLEIFSVKKITK